MDKKHNDTYRHVMWHFRGLVPNLAGKYSCNLPAVFFWNVRLILHFERFTNLLLPEIIVMSSTFRAKQKNFKNHLHYCKLKLFNKKALNFVNLMTDYIYL